MMYSHHLFRYFLAVALAAAAGCSAVSSGSAVTSMVSPEKGTAGARPWIDPQASSGNLLYVSDLGADSLFIYSYPSYKFVGYVPVGWEPVGECVDNQQNVWVTIFNYTLLEFAHGGTTPIATLGSPDILPRNCAVDRKTGDLAVTGYARQGSTELEIYKHAKGRPQTVATADGAAGCSYDGHGNLYVDGVSQSNFAIGVLQRGSKSLTYFQTTTPVNDPGSVAWDGQALAVGDYAKNSIYRFSISPSGVKLIATLSLNQSSGVGQFFIQRNRIIAPASDDDQNGGTLSMYPYPQGGNRIRTLRNMSLPDGAAISLGPKGTSL